VIEQGTGERMIRLELKYCERCGGLLLRRTGGAVVYCQSCAKSLSELPVMRKVEKVAVRKKGTTLASRGLEIVKTVEGCEDPSMSREGTAALGTTAGEVTNKKEPQPVGAPSPKGEGCGTPGVEERRLG
jgi:hypothetical protein